MCVFPLQDFALDPEESRMRAAAHHMVRFMTAGMALITCREPLLISINTNLKTAFLSALRVRVCRFTDHCVGLWCCVCCVVQRLYVFVSVLWTVVVLDFEVIGLSVSKMRCVIAVVPLVIVTPGPVTIKIITN